MIKKKMDHLLKLDDEIFAQYLFSQDPLKNKVTEEQKKDIIQKSLQEGQGLSRKLKKIYGPLSVDEYISKLGINLSYKTPNDGMEYIYFGTYQKPNNMTIYTENIEKGMDIVNEEQISALKNINLVDIVKSHELFHHFQETDKTLYINTNKITLWKLFKYEHTSTLISQAEIAGMAFAKDLLNLSFNPNVLDVLLLHLHDEDMSEKVYNQIKRFETTT